MANAVNWFQIQGKDGAALAKFYKKVFDWKMAPMPGGGGGGGGMVAPEEGGIGGGVGTTMDGSSKSLAVYVSVENLDAHIAKIEKAGGKRAMPNMPLPDNMGSIAGFIDPAGNWVGLWQEPAKTVIAAPAKKPAAATKKPAAKAAPAKKPAAAMKKPAAKAAPAKKGR